MHSRNTIQRQIILNAVFVLKNHPTADDVFDYIKQSHPTVSRATVYRNLNILADQGLLRHIFLADAADRFDHTLSEHYHIKCRQCGCFSDIPIPYQSDIDKKAEVSASFTDISHDIVFYGLCPDCKNKFFTKEGN